MILSVYCKECNNELEVYEVRELGTDIKIVVNTCECGDKKMCADCTKQLENQYTQEIDELKATIKTIREAIGEESNES